MDVWGGGWRGEAADIAGAEYEYIGKRSVQGVALDTYIA